MTNFQTNDVEYLSDPRIRRKNCPFLKKIVEMTRANSALYKKAIERYVRANQICKTKNTNCRRKVVIQNLCFKKCFFLV